MRRLILFLFVLLASTSAAQSLEEYQQKLAMAKTWAEEVSKFERTSSLIIEINYFDEALKKTRTAKNSQGEVGRSTLKALMDAPLMDAQALMDAAKKAAAEKNLETAWATQKREFLKAIVDPKGIAEAQATADLWSEVLDEWQAEVRKEGDDLRQALTEMPLIITGLLLEYENEHIERMLTTGSSGSSWTWTPLPPTNYTPTIDCPIEASHARIMSRMMLRHQRKIKRITD